MEQFDRTPKVSPEIYVYATNKNFLNLYDALRISKVKIEIAGYDPATNRQTGHASAWIDKDDARLLAHLVCNRLFGPVTGGKWEKYGGSSREDGSIESRTLLLEWDEGDGGRYARFPYRLTISNGPGRKTATGGVAPAGEPTARLSMRMPELDTIKVMLVLGDYLHAYETAHHHRLVAQRVNELRDKLAERGGNAPGNQAPGTPMRTPAVAPATSSLPQTARPAAVPGRIAESQAAPARPPLTAMPGGNREVARSSRLDTMRAG
ncbi:MAG: hypothetical protein M3014_03115 [Chloroflexota bacterium]|nr:hypothetical protein [Chloroflexota bacterium]